MEEPEIILSNDDFWFKVVGMLQQNWAIIEMSPRRTSCLVLFIHDAAGVFDRLEFESLDAARAGLIRNGFSRYADNEEAKRMVPPPVAPFKIAQHPNGPIYSSGRYWK